MGRSVRVSAVLAVATVLYALISLDDLATGHHLRRAMHRHNYLRPMHDRKGYYYDRLWPAGRPGMPEKHHFGRIPPHRVGKVTPKMCNQSHVGTWWEPNNSRYFMRTTEETGLPYEMGTKILELNHMLEFVKSAIKSVDERVEDIYAVSSCREDFAGPGLIFMKLHAYYPQSPEEKYKVDIVMRFDRHHIMVRLLDMYLGMEEPL